MPNWVSSVFILRPEDAAKILPFMNEDDAEKETGDIRLDFNKIIPMPDTVYQGASGFGENWHPPEYSSEEYRKKYPDGDWYKWSLANWGTKWNACHCSWNPPGEEDAYGILTIETAWSLPIPILETLHEDKKVDFQLYFVEESNAFFGAIPFTDDTTYPEYLDDEEGLKEPDRIFEMVKGESEYGWLYEDEFEALTWVLSKLRGVLNTIRSVKPEQDHMNLFIDTDYLQTVIKDGTSLIIDTEMNEPDFNVTARDFQNQIGEFNKNIQWLPEYIAPVKYDTRNCAAQLLLSAMQKLRMRALSQSVGMTEHRCNERLKEIARTEQIHKNNPTYRIPDTFTIDDVRGKRMLFKSILHGYNNENIYVKLENLLNIGRHRSTVESEKQLPWNYDNRTVDTVIETATALMELYDEIPTMETAEYLRMLDVYARTNLFHLDDEQVTTVSNTQIELLRTVARRLNVVRFKNMVQTGLLDTKFLTNTAAYLSTN